MNMGKHFHLFIVLLELYVLAGLSDYVDSWLG